MTEPNKNSLREYTLQSDNDDLQRYYQKSRRTSRERSKKNNQFSSSLLEAQKIYMQKPETGRM
jgi:hypothetical protein